MNKEVVYEYVECHVAISESCAHLKGATSLSLLQRFTIKICIELQKSKMLSLRSITRNCKKFYRNRNIFSF